MLANKNRERKRERERARNKRERAQQEREKKRVDFFALAFHSRSCALASKLEDEECYSSSLAHSRFRAPWKKRSSTSSLRFASPALACSLGSARRRQKKLSLTFPQGQVLHHPPGHVAGPLVGDELEHAAVRRTARGAVLGAEEHRVLDVEGSCFGFGKV